MMTCEICGREHGHSDGTYFKLADVTGPYDFSMAICHYCADNIAEVVVELSGRGTDEHL